MAAGSQSLDVSIAWLLYGVHMLSLPFWLCTSASALRRVRAARTAGKAGQQRGDSADVLPAQGEFFSLHLLAFYAAADALRGLDLCFDGTDGACRAVWGVVPLGLRLLAWAVRDIALLGAIGLYLDFILAWTHESLGWARPLGQHTLLRGAYALVMAGIAGSFWAVCATNRQSWQAVAVLFVVLLNAVWARTNLRLLRVVLPQVESRFNLSPDQVEGLALKEIHALVPGESAGGKSVDKAAPWVAAAAAEARLVARLVLAANAVILALFPLLAADRLIFRGAHWQPFIRELPVGTWVGGAASPRLAELPLDAQLNPSLEVAELLIGWLQWVYVASTARKLASARPPAELADSGQGYVGSVPLGRAVREHGVARKRA